MKTVVVNVLITICEAVAVGIGVVGLCALEQFALICDLVAVGVFLAGIEALVLYLELVREAVVVGVPVVPGGEIASGAEVGVRANWFTAVGVEVSKNGRTEILRANSEVIVSGGGINSPKLLLQSGIGPKDHLSEHNIKVVADVPGEHHGRSELAHASSEAKSRAA